MQNIRLEYQDMGGYIAFNAVGARFRTNAKTLRKAKYRFEKFLKRKKKRK